MMARKNKPAPDDKPTNTEETHSSASWQVRVLELPSGVCPFLEWRTSIRDTIAKARIAARITRILRDGNLGDHRERIKGGVSELRIDYGPGYRIYYAQVGSVIVVLIGGGTKDSQQSDIDTAFTLWEANKNEDARFSGDFGG